jgi:prepilin-type N-terminal cleavage/methylation domain-containing protein
MKTQRRRQGFSLIELLVVVFMLAVGLTSVSTLFVAGIVSSRKAERMSAAVNATRKEMERMRSSGFAGCTVNSAIFPPEKGYDIIAENVDGTGQVGFSVPGLPSGEGTIDVTYYDSGAGIYPNLKDIAVQVRWQGGTPMEGTFTLHTLVANHP